MNRTPPLPPGSETVEQKVRRLEERLWLLEARVRDLEREGKPVDRFDM